MSGSFGLEMDISNCTEQEIDPLLFKTNLKKLLLYLDPGGQAKIILTTAFWHHPGDTIIEELARETRLPLVTLGYLGEKDKMKAIGQFDHSDVANHPGDLGMATITERIYAALSAYL